MFYKESLRLKIFVNFFLLTLVIALTFTFLLVQKESKRTKKFLKKEGVLLSGILAHNSKLGIFSDSESSLRKATEGLYRYEKIVSISIFNQHGKILLQKSLGSNEKRVAMSHWDVVTANLAKNPSPFFVEREDFLTIWTPVLSSSFLLSSDPLFLDEKSLDTTNSRIIGYIRLVLSKKEIKEEIQNILTNSLLATLVILGVGSVFIFLIAIIMTNPLKKLAQNMRLFGEGEKTLEIEVKTEDEIGKIGLEFNKMILALDKREKEKERLEKELLQSEKLAAIGTLTSGIAHNFNNILCSITLSLNSLNMKTAFSDPSKAHIKRIFASSLKASSLVKNLLNFSRSEQGLSSKLVDINDILSKEEDIMRDLFINTNIDFSIELNPQPLMLYANIEQLDQVFLNLAYNAKDAIDESSGIISLSVDSATLDRDFLNNNPLCKEGKYAVISFIDNGKGMDEETKLRIFEPFFTTKEVDKGTGLGLSTVHGIIKRHNGLIHVFSNPGEGTIFRIYLPIADSEHK